MKTKAKKKQSKSKALPLAAPTGSEVPTIPGMKWVEDGAERKCAVKKIENGEAVIVLMNGAAVTYLRISRKAAQVLHAMLGKHLFLSDDRQVPDSTGAL